MDPKAPYPSDEHSFLEMHGHLLSMRGFLPQPVVRRISEPEGASWIDQSIVWNGESFKAPFIPTIECLGNESESSIGDKSDTEMVLELLQGSSVIDALNQVEGPWAIVYYRKEDDSIYFGRDPRGRRSLMLGHGGDKDVVISSLPWRMDGIHLDWIEVDTKGIYQLHLKTGEISLHAWPAETRLLSQRLDIVPVEDIRISDDDIIKELTDVLRLSIRRRVHFRGDHIHLKVKSEEASPSSTPISEPSQSSPINAPVAVLFSGGLDSTVLAALVNKELPEGVPIDLINVAFGDEKQTSNAPDRVTCMQSYDDLLQIAPKRPWRLVLVNVPKTELEHCMSEVASLMFPNNTLMDISISAPLWFAARGIGISTETGGQKFVEPLIAYQSTAKVMILGAGADEQFAGYGRHRVSFKRGGWQGLQDELDKDIKRLWKRNLGRDDRVLSDHGKEARFPFLDADVMRWISAHFLSDLCDMSLPPGEGDKRALRLVAQDLGLTVASKLPKRAIQFGTKITKQMPRGKGTDNFEM
jgi:asparagine synthetase B (glutamine-hydrolysing)